MGGSLAVATLKETVPPTSPHTQRGLSLCERGVGGGGGEGPLRECEGSPGGLGGQTVSRGHIVRPFSEVDLICPKMLLKMQLNLTFLQFENFPWKHLKTFLRENNGQTMSVLPVRDDALESRKDILTAASRFVYSHIYWTTFMGLNH